jgi:uncharacterized protein (TIGR02145 family)
MMTRSLYMCIGIWALLICSCKAQDIVTPEMPILGSITDSRDAEVYQTVKIGDQNWMAENLRYNAKGSWLNPANPNVSYGRLYDWETIMNGESSTATNPSKLQGLCPEGWHLPSDLEWQTMEQTLGLSPDEVKEAGFRGNREGLELKTKTGWLRRGGGTNKSKFSAYPTGVVQASGAFSGIGYYTSFWTSTEKTEENAWGRTLRELTYIIRSDASKKSGRACRCIEDN